MTRSTDITSFTEHRRNLRLHLDRVKKSGRPLYVTTNGRTEAVILSARAYDELADRADLAGTLTMLRQSEKDVSAGRVRPAAAALREVGRKHKLLSRE